MKKVINTITSSPASRPIFFSVIAICGLIGIAVVSFSFTNIGFSSMIGGVTILLLIGLIPSILLYHRNTNKLVIDKTNSIAKKNSFNDLSHFRHTFFSKSFEESLNLKNFNDDLIQYNMSKSEGALRKYFNLSPGNKVKIIESVKFIKDRNKIVWNLSKEGKKLLKAGKVEWTIHKESGQFLPSLRNVKGKKFQEFLKGTNPGKVAHLTKIANVVVNAAHIISGADLSKKLNQANIKLDYLVEGRKIDKISELESLYYSLKEITNNTNSVYKKQNIQKIHEQLRTIRIALRNELDFHLKNIQDPKSNSLPFLRKIFSFDRTKDEKIYNKVLDVSDHIKLIDYCFALDLAICSYINQDPVELTHELERFEKTANLLNTKKNYLTGAFPEFSLDRESEYLFSIPAKYKSFTRRTPLVA